MTRPSHLRAVASVIVWTVTVLAVVITGVVVISLVISLVLR
jgi:hypothetical protein